MNENYKRPVVIAEIGCNHMKEIILIGIDHKVNFDSLFPNLK